MFAGLGHNAFVCVYDKEHEVDACSAGQHISDKFFMARDVHDTDPLPVGKHERRKAQVNRDAPGFFLFQPIRIDACDTPDQGRFAVVDVPCRTKDDMFQSGIPILSKMSFAHNPLAAQQVLAV
jgi:hypothetical protein